MMLTEMLSRLRAKRELASHVGQAIGPLMERLDVPTVLNSLRQRDTSRQGGGSSLDSLQTAADVAGVADPSGIVDAVNAAVYVGRAATAKTPAERREHLINAGISAVSVVPYVGDLAKVLKYGKRGKAIRSASRASRAGPSSPPAAASVQHDALAEAIRQQSRKTPKAAREQPLATDSPLELRPGESHLPEALAPRRPTKHAQIVPEAITDLAQSAADKGGHVLPEPPLGLVARKGLQGTQRRAGKTIHDLVGDMPGESHLPEALAPRRPTKHAQIVPEAITDLAQSAADKGGHVLPEPPLGLVARKGLQGTQRRAGKTIHDLVGDMLAAHASTQTPDASSVHAAAAASAAGGGGGRRRPPPAAASTPPPEDDGQRQDQQRQRREGERDRRSWGQRVRESLESGWQSAAASRTERDQEDVPLEDVLRRDRAFGDIMSGKKTADDIRQEIEGERQLAETTNKLVETTKELTGAFGVLVVGSVLLHKSIRAVGAALIARQQAIGQFSGPMGAAAARLEAHRVGRQIETGQLTGQSFESLTNAVNSLEQQTVRYQAFATNVMNTAVAALTHLVVYAQKTVEALTPLEEIVDWLNELMGAADKARAPAYFRLLEDIRTGRIGNKPTGKKKV